MILGHLFCLILFWSLEALGRLLTRPIGEPPPSKQYLNFWAAKRRHLPRLRSQCPPDVARSISSQPSTEEGKERENRDFITKSLEGLAAGCCFDTAKSIASLASSRSASLASTPGYLYDAHQYGMSEMLVAVIGL